MSRLQKKSTMPKYISIVNYLQRISDVHGYFNEIVFLFVLFWFFAIIAKLKYE